MDLARHQNRPPPPRPGSPWRTLVALILLAGFAAVFMWPKDARTPPEPAPQPAVPAGAATTNSSGMLRQQPETGLSSNLPAGDTDSRAAAGQ